MDIITVRRPNIVMILSIVTLLNVLFIRAYFAILSDLKYSQYDVENLNDSRIRTPAIWFTQFTANLLLFRIWIIFYEWRRAVHILQLKWSQQLLSDQTQHWTLKYGKLLGNEKLLIIIAICHYIGGVILCIIAIEVNHGENGLFYDTIIVVDAVIIMIPFFILSFVSQKFHDSLGVRDEIRGLAIIFIIGSIGVASGAWISKSSVFRSQGSYAWTCIISLCIVCRLVYVKQLQQRINPSDMSIVSQVVRSFSVHKSDDDIHDQETKTVPFRDVLRNREGFKLFAEHLLKEFSVETLLFLLELTQIKRAIIDHYRELFASNNSTHYLQIQHDIERAIDAITFTIDIAPEILHLSDDVHKNMDITKVITLWKYLYHQYIDESANSAINISHSVRQRILDCINKNNLMSNNNNDSHIGIDIDITSDAKPTVSDEKTKLEWHNTIMELIEAYDCAAKEIFVLLETDSWQRFRVSKEFESWKKQFHDNQQRNARPVKKRKFTL